MKVIQLPPIYQGGQVVLLARLEDDDATLLLRAEISSVTFKVYDKADPKNVILTTTPTVSSVVNDTTAVTNGWTLDSAANPDPRSGLYGWNLRYKTPITFFPLGKRTYVVECKVVEVSGDESAQTWEQPTLKLLQAS
jgi:hypothetical protein